MATSTRTLRSDRLTLRPVQDPELPALVELLQDPAVREWWGENTVASLREQVDDQTLEVWTIEVDGEPAGLIQASEETDPDYKSVELDLFIGEPFFGRGLGAEAIRTVLRMMFEQRGHHRALIIPAIENERAIRSYERVGFKPVGRLRKAERAIDGRWRDGLMMDLLAEELS
jgi:aminoglycoside 6'-N-acetyltransferase